MGVKYLNADGIVIRQGIYQESLTQKADLGRFIDLEDGRRYRYCKAEGAITKGHVCQSAAVVGDQMDIAQTAILAIGDKDDLSIVVDAAPTKNDYAEGFLFVNDGDGQGEMYKIKKNSGASPCIVSLYDAIRVATASGSELSMIQSKYKDVFVCAAGAQPTGAIVGVPNITVTTGGYYFWAQTKGYCAMHIETAITVGIDVTLADTTTAGAVELRAVYTDVILGLALHTSTEDLDYGVIDLKLE